LSRQPVVTPGTVSRAGLLLLTARDASG